MDEPRDYVATRTKARSNHSRRQSKSRNSVTEAAPTLDSLSPFHQNATREQVVTSRAAPSPSIPYERSCRPADSRLCRPADLNNDKPFAGRCDSGASWRA